MSIARARWHIIVLAVVLGVVAGVPAQATTAGVLIVRGAAGSTVDVTLDAPLTLPAVGPDYSQASDGGWSAVSLVSTKGSAVSRHVFLHATLPESWRCPGGACPWTVAAPADLGDLRPDGRILLPAGRYHVLLAGAPGTQVTATFRSTAFRRSTTLVARSRALNYHASTSQGRSVGGRDVLLHAYDQIPAGGTFGLAISFQTHAVDPPATIQDAECITAGSNTQVTQTVGGVTPCYDLQGEDFYARPVPGVVTPTPMNGSFAPVAGAYGGVYGNSDASLGTGTDLSVVAPTTSYLRRLFIGFETS